MCRGGEGVEAAGEHLTATVGTIRRATRISGDTGGRIVPQHFCFGRKAFFKKSRSFKGTRSPQAEEGREGRMRPVVH